MFAAEMRRDGMEARKSGFNGFGREEVVHGIPTSLINCLQRLVRYQLQVKYHFTASTRKPCISVTTSCHYVSTKRHLIYVKPHILIRLVRLSGLKENAVIIIIILLSPPRC